MTNEEIIAKINETLAEEFEVDINVIKPDAPLMETLELDSLDKLAVTTLSHHLVDCLGKISRGNLGHDGYSE